MKKATLTFTFFLSAFCLHAQLEDDCSKHFYSINSFGVVQQWTLENDSIFGGEEVFTDGGSGLAYGTYDGQKAFYSDISSGQSLDYLDQDDNWQNVLSNSSTYNMGGFENHIYSMSFSTAGTQILSYYDGEDFYTAANLGGIGFFSVADIAVDTAGNAWGFISENTPTEVSSVVCYEKNISVKNYAITFVQDHCYGTTFIDNMLYIGVGSTSASLESNSMYPVILDETNMTASLGDPIPFLSDDFYDLASCASLPEIVLNTNELLEGDILVYPNPGTGLFNIQSNYRIFNIQIFNELGQLIDHDQNNKQVDLKEAANGMYLLRIETDAGMLTKRIVKF